MHSRSALRKRASRLDDPLRHDFLVLLACEDDPSSSSYEEAVRTRKRLARDTLAPDFLRAYADEVVRYIKACYPA